MDGLLAAIGDNIVYLVIGACFLAGFVTKSLTTIVTNAAREKSRREIAAYVAEGSISPEQGERLIRAETRRTRAECC